MLRRTAYDATLMRPGASRSGQVHSNEQRPGSAPFASRGYSSGSPAASKAAEWLSNGCHVLIFPSRNRNTAADSNSSPVSPDSIHRTWLLPSPTTVSPVLDEPIRDDPRTHVVEALLERRARFLVSTHTRPAWDQHLDIGREQRQKLGYAAAVVEELDPPAGDCAVRLRHRVQYRPCE